jgi:hypothetical protein
MWWRGGTGGEVGSPNNTKGVSESVFTICHSQKRAVGKAIE